jgi:hypothetical protein
MHFALIDNVRVEATPNLKGAVCPVCSQPVIAKCGNQRIFHWAHRSLKNCDNWWEPETGWHRSWKNRFPQEWQEVVMFDSKTGEKHVADVRTIHNLVLEFQHSHMEPQERVARESFYKNMIWIVDGTRLKRDYPRFAEGKTQFRSTVVKRFFLISFPDESFPSEWLHSSVPVVFDFRGNALPIGKDDEIRMREPLWCLLPGRAEGHAVVVALLRTEFIEIALKYPQLFEDSYSDRVNTFAELIRQNRKRTSFQPRRKKLADSNHNSKQVK